MKKIVVGPETRTDTPDFAQHVVGLGIQPGENYQVVRTKDAYATDLAEVVGSDPFHIGPGIMRFRDDDEYAEHLEQRLNSKYDWDITLDQFSKVRAYQDRKRGTEKAGEFIAGAWDGAGAMLGQAASAVGEAWGAAFRGDLKSLALTNAEAGARLATSYGVSFNNIKGSIGALVKGETLREEYERVMDQKHYADQFATEEHASMVGDMYGTSQEHVDAINESVMSDAADVASIVADVALTAGAAGLLNKGVKMAQLGKNAKLASAARKFETVSALPGNAGKKIAQKSLEVAGYAGKHMDKAAVGLGHAIDKVMKSQVGNSANTALVGALIGGGQGAVTAVAARHLGYPSLKAAAKGSRQAAIGAYTAARHMVTQAGPKQLNYWQNIMRDTTAPSWMRSTAAAANHVFGRRSSRILGRASHGGIVEATQEALSEWIQDPNNFESVGEAAGGAFVIGGALHGALSLGSLDKIEAFYRDLDRVDYRNGLQDPSHFDSLPEADQFALSDAAAFLGDEFTVVPLNGAGMSKALGGDYPLPTFATPAGAYNAQTGTLLINTSAKRPAQATLMHEVGHAVYDSIPQERKAAFRTALEQAYGKDTVSKFAQDYARSVNRPEIPESLAIDEMFAEHFMGNTDSPLFQATESLPKQVRQTLKNARGAIFREWARKAQLDPTKPEGLLPFTPWANDPSIRDMVNREVNHILTNPIKPVDLEDIEVPEPAEVEAQPPRTEPKTKSNNEPVSGTPRPADSPRPDSSHADPAPANPASAKPAAPAPKKHGPAESVDHPFLRKVQLDADDKVVVPPIVTRMVNLYNDGKSLQQIADEIQVKQLQAPTQVQRVFDLYEQHTDLGRISLEDAKKIRSERTNYRRRTTRNPKRKVKSPEKMARNLQIYAAVQSGKTHREVGGSFGLSHTAIGKIVKQVHEQKLKDQKEGKVDVPKPGVKLSPDPYDLADASMPADASVRADLTNRMASGNAPFQAFAAPDGTVQIPIGVEGSNVLLVDAADAYAETLLEPGEPYANYQRGLAQLRAGGDPWFVAVRSTPVADLNGFRLLSDDGFLDHSLARSQRATADVPHVNTLDRNPKTDAFNWLAQSQNLPKWQLSELGTPLAETQAHVDYAHPTDGSRVMRVPRGFSEPTLTPDGQANISPKRPLAYIDQMEANADLGGDVVFEGVVQTPTGPRPLHSLPKQGAPVHETDVDQEGVRPDGYRLSPSIDAFHKNPLTGEVTPRGAMVYRQTPDFGKSGTILADLVRNNPEGFTFSVQDGAPPEGGFAVAPSKATELFIAPEELTPEALKNYFLQHENVFAREGVNLGGWFDKSSNRYVLDASWVLSNRDTAVDVAIHADQDAIFDLNTFTEIRTKHTDGRPKLPNDDSRDLEAILANPIDPVSVAETTWRNQRAVGRTDGEQRSQRSSESGEAALTRLSPDGGGTPSGHRSHWQNFAPGNAGFLRGRGTPRSEFLGKNQNRLLGRIWSDLGPESPNFQSNLQDYEALPIVHYSDSADVTSLDPARHGKGVAGDELKRKREHPLLFPPRTYFGDTNYARNPEGSVQSRAKSRIDGIVDKGKLMHPGNPAWGDFIQRAKDMAKEEEGSPNGWMTYWESMLDANGFAGYYVPNMQAGVLFREVSVPKSARSSDTSPGERAASAKIEPDARLYPSVSERVRLSSDIQVSQVDPAQDSFRVGTAKLGTKATPQDTPQSSNIGFGYAMATVPAKKMKEMVDKMAQPFYKKDGEKLNSGVPASIRRLRNPKKRAEALIEHFKTNLLALHDAFPEQLRARATQWYDGANSIAQEMADQWGLTVQQTSGVLAVLSPQKDWFMNVAQGRQALQMYFQESDSVIEGDNFERAFQENLEGLKADKKIRLRLTKELGLDTVLTKGEAEQQLRDYRSAIFDKLRGRTIKNLAENPTLQAWAIRMSAEARLGRDFHVISPEGDTLGVQIGVTGKPVKNGWGSAKEIEKLVSIVQDGSMENISNQLGEKHKVRNFFNNIVAPNNSVGDATMDTHAVAAAHLLPLGSSAPEVSANFGGTGSPSKGVNGTYHIYLEAYKQAAAERGLQPRQMQSITWEAIRGLFLPDDRKGAKVFEVRDLWDAHKSEPEKARNEILSRTIRPPFWAE